jgi:hypothetical protein
MAENPVRTLIKSTVGIGVIIGALALLGLPYGFGFAAWLVVGLLGLGLLTDVGGRVSVAYILSLFGLFALGAAVVPSDLFGPFQGLLDVVLGPFPQLDPLVFALLVAASIFVVWVVDIRFISGSAKKPSTIIKRLRKRTNRLVDTHVTSVRLAAVSIAMIAATVIAELGQASGEILDLIAQAPVVASNFTAVLGGYVALGGDVPYLATVPILSGLDAVDYVVLMAVVLAIAYAARLNQ